MSPQRLDTIIKDYEKLVKGINQEAINNEDRAYGGIIRAGKGKLVESITQALVEIAWITVLKQDPNRLRTDKNKMKIGIKEGYENKIKNNAVREYINLNRDKLFYRFGTDVHVYIDDKLVLPIECKAYTENAMLKRILFDAVLMKEAKGINKYFLLQLESQLGGDYSKHNGITYGSASTHVLMSHVNVDLEIITLLEGERKVDRPIHKAEYYKPLTVESLNYAVNVFSDALKYYIK